MNSFERLFKTDEKLENEGVEVPVGVNEKGDPIILIVGALHNPKHEKAIARYEKLIRATSRNPKRHREAMAKVYAAGLLFGWKGPLDDDGKPLKYTTKEGEKILLEYKNIYFEVLTTAADEQLFLANQEEEDAANLKP